MSGMAVALHTDPSSLPRSFLDARFKHALEEVERKQRASGPLARGASTVLDDGTRFVPDGQDAKGGQAWTTVGLIAALFGLAFLGILIEGKQAEDWMRLAGPVLLGAGAYLTWSGRAKSRVATNAPRVTGAYLFSDALLHVGTFGCRVFPKERVRGFEYRTGGDRSARLLVSYTDEHGAKQEDVLFYEDARAPLEEWLASTG